jgi:hypothetical protein
VVTEINSYPIDLPPRVLQSDAVQRAIEYGVDITLLISYLRLTPTERVLRAKRRMNSVLAIQREAKLWQKHQLQIQK